MKKFELFAGLFPGGTIYANKAIKENGDYKNLALVSPAGNIRFYCSPETIPAEALEKIKSTAERNEAETRARLDRELTAPGIYEGQTERHAAGIVYRIADRLPLEAASAFLDSLKDAPAAEKNKLIIDKYCEIF